MLKITNNSKTIIKQAHIYAKNKAAFSSLNDQ